MGEGQQTEWLLIKKQDLHSTDEDIIEKDRRGVLSGLTGEENFHKAALVTELTSLVASAPEKAVPAQGLTPMLCALEGANLVDAERLYELKLDGVRIVADKRGGQVALRYRNGRSATANYGEIARALSLLPIGDALLDGEIVTFDAEGKPSFERLAPRIGRKRAIVAVARRLAMRLRARWLEARPEDHRSAAPGSVGAALPSPPVAP